MFIRRIIMVMFIAALGCYLSGIALASTTGYEPGNPQSGLILALILVLVIIIFASAVAIMIRIGDRRVKKMKENHDVSGLITALHSPSLSIKAAAALAEIGDDSVMELLENALSDEHEAVRRASARALGKIGNERAIGPLTRALDDSYASVRDCARLALEKIKEKNKKYDY